MRAVAAAASTNAARALGLEAGTIAAGRPADLVHLDENLQVRHVIRGGRITSSP
jgi:N-acetylglucosamine-6-phosphate deacetylase